MVMMLLTRGREWRKTRNFDSYVMICTHKNTCLTRLDTMNWGGGQGTTLCLAELLSAINSGRREQLWQWQVTVFSWVPLSRVLHQPLMDSLKPMITLTALIKPSGSQNKTKRREFEKGSFRKVGGGRPQRVEWRIIRKHYVWNCQRTNRNKKQIPRVPSFIAAT